MHRLTGASLSFAAILATVAITWKALNLYTLPPEKSQRGPLVRQYLADALEGDSARLLMKSGSRQPMRWVLTAARLDSTALREWVVGNSRVSSHVRTDTIWITLRRNRGTDRCPFMSSLTAALSPVHGPPRFVHLSASCPTVDTSPRPARETAPPGTVSPRTSHLSRWFAPPSSRTPS